MRATLTIVGDGAGWTVCPVANVNRSVIVIVVMNA
jgi:hypothetical protein